jgi:hypothetical protein
MTLARHSGYRCCALLRSFDLLYDARGNRAPMLIKLLALAAAAIPVLLFARTVLLRRPTRLSRNFQEFKRQVDLAVWLLIAIIGAAGALTLARMAWTWWAGL